MLVNRFLKFIQEVNSGMEPLGNEPGPNAFQAFVRTSYTRVPQF